jgi:predicted dehydrogenase
MPGELTVGVIGYHIARVLAKALLDLPLLYPSLGSRIRLKTLCGRDRGAVTEAASALGFEGSTDRWQALVEDPEIDLLLNGAPNYLHAEPCIAALRASKHVFCEKPLARSLGEAVQMREAAQRAAGQQAPLTMVGFNYRFIPAVVLARRLIREGRLGRIRQGQFRYVDEAFLDPASLSRWVRDRELSGRGVLGDLGSHAVDLARYLLGEPAAVAGFTRIFTGDRRVTAPDAALGVLHYEGGSLFSLEASSCCTGRKNWLAFELYGQEGALSWNLERLNELQVYLRSDRERGAVGFQRVYVSRVDHPQLLPWPPVEHPTGIELSYLLEMRHLVRSIADGKPVPPEGADFEDGLQVERICEALERSSREGGAAVEIGS